MEVVEDKRYWKDVEARKLELKRCGGQKVTNRKVWRPEGCSCTSVEARGCICEKPACQWVSVRRKSFKSPS
jgi:hypothetical protein